MKKSEIIYIAGPECFFENGNDILGYMRVLSESYGHKVSLPNDDPLKLDHEDLRLNADAIFGNLKQKMNETTMIIGDLDQFRGAEPDSGTIYEIGMAYARNLIIYGHTRDKRSLVWKDQKIKNIGNEIYDENGKLHPYYFLPFAPLVMASTKIVEGNYTDVLAYYETDKYLGYNAYERKKEGKVAIVPNSVFVAFRDYYDSAAVLCELEKAAELVDAGYQVITPYFRPYNHKESIQVWLEELILENVKRVDQCEYFVADLNDYRGYECSNDVAFLSGYALQTGKKLFGFMADTRPMIEKIPNHFTADKYKDPANRNVENFNYPINLMFASSMKIIEGGFKEWLTEFLAATSKIPAVK